MLCMLYYKTSNMRNVYGGRTGLGTHTGWSAPADTGQCDSIIGLNGYETVNDCVKMLGIENPYGNVPKCVDGVLGVNNSYCIWRLPQYYTNSRTGDYITVIPNTANGYIKYMNLQSITNPQYFSYPKVVDATGSASTYYGCSTYKISSSQQCMGGSYNNSDSGLWNVRGYGLSDNAYTSSRLAYRPATQ